MWYQLTWKVNGKWNHTRCSVLINLLGFHCSQKASHEVFVLPYEISYNQVIFHELQKVSWCEEVGLMFWELPEELDSNACFIYKLSPFSSYGGVGVPELIVKLDHFRDLVQNELWIDKHSVW